MRVNVMKILEGQGKAIQCAAVSTANYQHGVEACTTYGRFGNVLKNDKYHTYLH
jgi:hypothetical protein